MVGKAGQGARVGRQMLLVMHAACPPLPLPLPLQIVVDVYVAQPGPLYGASLSGSVGSAAGDTRDLAAAAIAHRGSRVRGARRERRQRLRIIIKLVKSPS
jgi:hypothetical protein